jgi:hypothetical protein
VLISGGTLEFLSLTLDFELFLALDFELFLALLAILLGLPLFVPSCWLCGFSSSK